MSVIWKRWQTPMRDFSRRLRASQSGAVLIEFAYCLPIFMLFGVSALELVNLQVSHMRLSMITMTVADNLSRAKQSVPLGLPQLREVDINDALIGAKIQAGDSFPLLEQGRIIVSSLQVNAAGRQTVMWQRCKGVLNRNSLYGAQGATQPATGTTGFQGMGTGANRVQAEPNSAVIFAEVVYKYKPIFGGWVFGERELRKEASFYVRDDRDLVGNPTAAPDSVWNPSPGSAKAACNLFTSTF
jgi:hypothetical protein